MVALQFLALFGVLPVLALGAAQDAQPRNAVPHGMAVRRSRAHSVGGGLSHSRSVKSMKKKRNGKCRPRPAAPAAEPEQAEAAPEAGEPVAAEEETPSEEPVAEQPAAEEPAAEEPAAEEPAAEQPAAEEPAAEEPTAEEPPTEQPAAEETAAEQSEDADIGFSNTVALAHGNDGLLNMAESTCGACPSTSSEPNGAQWWLDCGVDNGGWNPPAVKMHDIVYKELNADGLFAPCAPYIDKFHQYAAEFNLPPILLASIAMQESTCNPNVTGGIGECGLMQLLGPNCDGAPNGNCYDVDFNIRRGAEYLSQVLEQHNGNALAALGAYNGWYLGMTVGEVYAMKDAGRCFAQPNLDYLHQMLNGWMQGIEPYTMGKYFNRKDC